MTLRGLGHIFHLIFTEMMFISCFIHCRCLLSREDGFFLDNNNKNKEYNHSSNRNGRNIITSFPEPPVEPDGEPAVGVQRT